MNSRSGACRPTKDERSIVVVARAIAPPADGIARAAVAVSPATDREPTAAARVPSRSHSSGSWGLACALALAASPSFATRSDANDDALVFAPPIGLPLKRDVRESTRWTLRSIRQLREGVDLGLRLPQMHGETSLRLGWTDTYRDVAPPFGRCARPLRFDRSLDEIGGRFELTASLDGANEVQSFRWSSPYEGWDLGLQWNGGEETYVAHRVGESIDHWNLAARSDLAAWLPVDLHALQGEAEWSIPPEAVRMAFTALGSLDLEPIERSPGPYRLIQPQNLGVTSVLSLRELAEGIGGRTTARWKAPAPRAGEVAPTADLVELELDLTVDADTSDSFARMLAATEVDLPRDSMSMRTSGRLRGKGTLDWSREEFRARALSLRLEFILKVELAWYEDRGGGEEQTTIEAELEGVSELRWRVERGG